LDGKAQTVVIAPTLANNLQIAIIQVALGAKPLEKEESDSVVLENSV
jgi:hypothetical protein